MRKVLNFLTSSYLPKFLLMILVLLYMAWYWYTWGYIEDDGFIHLEYAKNIAERGEFAFQGVKVNGDSSPLWTILISLLIKIGLTPYFAIKVASLMGFGIAVSGLYQISKKILCNDKLWASLFSIYIATSPFFLHWSFSGMESLTALGMICWILYLLEFRTENNIKILLIFIFAGLMPLVRFELMPFCFFIPIYYIFINKFTKNKLIILVFTIITFIPFSIWAFYALHEFGSVIPTTNSAKKLLFTTELLMHLLENLRLFFWDLEYLYHLFSYLNLDTSLRISQI